MLDRMQEAQLVIEERRRAGEYLLPVTFLGAAGIAMIAWIAALLWASWSLMTWIFQ